MSSLAYRAANSHEKARSAAAPACEACRKLKMKCTRTASEGDENSLSEPCSRCKRTNRPCKAPESRPLGRRRGALGRYRGLEKAYRKLQAEAKKANISHGFEELYDSIPLTPDEGLGFDSFLTDESSGHPRFPATSADRAAPGTAFLGPEVRTPGTAIPADPRDDVEVEVEQAQEPMSNPLELLARASDAAQASETSPSLVNASTSQECKKQPRCEKGETEGYRLLHRPGYVSLGLQLDRASLVQGLDTLLDSVDAGHQALDYFNRTGVRQRDVGPDLDPVELGLVTMEDAHYLFPMYFTRLHPINGILDPMLHSPEFVRGRSSLLFTWILALTAQFDNASASIAERLRRHGDKLSRYVHTCGYKSVEIVQGYYISLLSATPAKTLAEERSWLYTMYAIGVATDLGMDQEAGPAAYSRSSGSRHDQSFPSPYSRANEATRHSLEGPWTERRVYEERILRNRERTWLRILLWERANSAARGRYQSFPETSLTRSIDAWWLHPLADMTDKYTSAFIILRKVLAALQAELKHQAQVTQSDPHWVRNLVDDSLYEWCNTWLPKPQDLTSASPPEQVSMTFLNYVYKHGRLWTLSLALSDSGSRAHNIHATRQACFESAVNCCETAVRDLGTIGEPLYCMLAPTWAMISYAAVLTLKIFPALYGTRTGSEVELLALLSQVALQLQHAGTTPSHRFGVAALLGQHLMMILRARAVDLREPPPSQTQNHAACHGPIERQPAPSQMSEGNQLVLNWDPFLTPATSDQNGVAGDGFADYFREIFGPEFGDLL
ncbi:Zn(II)2Cys6 transcription factor [Aspergillus foveolatus]|uniref:Zn(II)2Cys6 transcription factor n=1 Tax=Aspergillus foveolatus TaxID=210207 RepID=UPI003CCE4233